MTNFRECTVLEAIPTVMYNSSEFLEAMVIPDSSYGCLILWKRAYCTRGCYSFEFDSFVGQMFIAQCSVHAQCSQLQSVETMNWLPPGQLSYKM